VIVCSGDLLTSQQQVKDLEASHEDEESGGESGGDEKAKDKKTKADDSKGASAAHADPHPVVQKNHKEITHGQNKMIEQLTLLAETQTSLAQSVQSLVCVLFHCLSVCLLVCLRARRSYLFNDFW
jgi:hypothetical protein